MKFLDTSRALVLASIVAMCVLQLAAEREPIDPDYTCIFACNPNGTHGCRDDCPVCDPVLRRCVPKGGIGTPLPPPPPPTVEPPPLPSTEVAPPPPPTGTGAPPGGSTTPSNVIKCTAYVKTPSGSGISIRERPTLQSANVGIAPGGWATIELTEKVNGETVLGNSNWFKYNNGWVNGRFLTVNSGGPAWCTN